MATIEDPRRYFSKRQKQQLEVLGHLRSIFFRFSRFQALPGSHPATPGS
jgi:hypothetical protein